MNFMMITNDPGQAFYAQSCGVQRIFVDLEVIGKQKRQGHLDTLISKHSVDDIAPIREGLSTSELLVRLNPLHEGSQFEIDESIRQGANIVMLPMFFNVDTLKRFSDIVDGRVKIIPLVETYLAAKSMSEIVSVPGVSEVYIGLNDLHLDMKLDFMFEPLSMGFVDELAGIIKEAGLPFGFGGVARVGEGVIPGELILAEHLRLGSSSVILSRTFSRSDITLDNQARLIFKSELEKLVNATQLLKKRNANTILADKNKLKDLVSQYVMNKKC